MTSAFDDTQNVPTREQQDLVAQALTSKQSASALAEVLEDAVGVGTSDSELAAGLRRRLDSAREWEARAATLLDGPNRPPLAELQSLVAEGGALGVRMERLAAATVAATAAAAWVSRAEHAARSDASPAEHVTLEEIEALLEEYGRLAAALPQASLLASKRDAARQWVERAQAALEQPPSESRAAEYEVSLYAPHTGSDPSSPLITLQFLYTHKLTLCLCRVCWLRAWRQACKHHSRGHCVPAWMRCDGLPSWLTTEAAAACHRLLRKLRGCWQMERPCR